MNNENILINYLHQTVYNNSALNVIGATTNSTLRTLDTIAGDTAYVRKFGTDYEITDVTSLEDPVDVNLTVSAYAYDGTLLGSRTGGGAFVDGSTVATAQGIYIKCTASGGAVTLNTFGPVYSIHTDVDAGGKAFYLPQDVIADGDDLYFCLSKTGSSYYMEDTSDFDMIYGGARHTPALNDEDTPYFTITTALAALAGATDGVIILDSAVYTEEITISNSYIIQAALGQTPTLYNCCGTNPYNIPTAEYNNTTAVYFNESGSDTTGDGTWQNPYNTPDHAITNRGALHVVYGGTGCPAYLAGQGYFDALTMSAGFNLESDHFYAFNQYAKITVSYSNNTLQGIYCTNIEEGTYGIEIGRSGSAAGTNGVNLYYMSIVDVPGGGSGINFENYSEGEINIKYCYFQDLQFGINTDYDGFRGTVNFNIEKNIVKGVRTDGVGTVGIAFNDQHTSGTESWTIRNNLIVNHSNCIYLWDDSAATKTMLVEHNTIIITSDSSGTSNGICLYDAIGGSSTLTVKDNLVYGCTYCIEVDEASAAMTTSYCCFYDYTAIKTGSGTHTNNNGITDDPKFIDTTNDNYGIRPDGSCYKSNGSENNVGCEFGLILISSSTPIINGLIIDGNDNYFSGIYKTGATDYTDLTVKWCIIQNCYCNDIDDYSGSDTDSDFTLNIFNGSGNSLVMEGGGDTVDQNIFYSNVFGIFINCISTFDHNVLYGNSYGIYLLSIGSIVKNSIYDHNTIYDIYSNFSKEITYSCITGTVNNLVDITDSTNTINNPLFVDPDNNNFYIKTVYGGDPDSSQKYGFNSPCIDNADDGYDIGAYLMDRSLTSDAWKKYQFPTGYNPRKVTYQLKILGMSKLRTATGQLKKWAIDSKRIYTMKWDSSQASTGELRKKLEYLLQLMQMRTNDNEDGDDLLRLTFLPTGHIDSGTGATVDVTALTLTDSAKSWVENELKGFWTALIWDSDTGNGTITAATKKLQVAPSPVWTNDEWIGYYFPYNGYYYYITDNDADELTLSDPDGTLSNAASIDWSIVKYFKVLSNTATILTLQDDDSELSSTPTAYYVDFIEVKISSNGLTANQKRYYYEQESWKTGFNLDFEEF